MPLASTVLCRMPRYTMVADHVTMETYYYGCQLMLIGCRSRCLCSAHIFELNFDLHFDFPSPVSYGHESWTIMCKNKGYRQTDKNVLRKQLNRMDRHDWLCFTLTANASVTTSISTVTYNGICSYNKPQVRSGTWQRTHIVYLNICNYHSSCGVTPCKRC